MEITSLDFMPVFLAGFTLKLLMAGAGYYFIRFILQHLDRGLDFSFKEWIHNASDDSKAVYLGLRILSICIFVAWVVS